MLTQYETKRLLLKVLTPNWCHSVLHFYSSNRSFFCPYESACPPAYYTADYQRSSLVYEYNSYKNGTGVRFYLFLKERPQSIIGTISFTNILYSCYQSACIGYKLDKNHQHNGYAAEALQKGIEIMFKESGLHRLDAYILPNNRPSIRLIERLGFTHEGLCREYAYILDKWQDHERYSLLSSTFLHQ